MRGNIGFTRRSRESKLKESLLKARIEFTNYAKRTDDPKWDWGKLWKLEDEVKRLEYEVWAEEYEDNRRRNWG